MNTFWSLAERNGMDNEKIPTLESTEKVLLGENFTWDSCMKTRLRLMAGNQIIHSYFADWP